MSKQWFKLRDKRPRKEFIGTCFEIEGFIFDKPVKDIFIVTCDKTYPGNLIYLKNAYPNGDDRILLSHWETSIVYLIKWRYITDKNEILSYQLMSL